ncbi:hypothetical protein BTA51_25525 [Hahella sp. CCB-MM4]|uniref:oligosaccharide flippase family protein n=1 Tax=Hahella sp. (strain CCB-MM4) TaxID=1926491 RepID=UPI000B9B70FF|nr:oligosaccharide flippase family protein [Hahella sp. CCB-MM4]OZG70497.1 hypothetical protein BTA51_25525 [Hahella sp. CCB-MM4]
MLKSTLISQSAIYLLTNIINKSIPFLLLPVITRYLSPSEYGVLAVFQVIVSFSSPFVGLSLHTHITRNFKKSTEQHLRSIIRKIIAILISSTVLALFLISTFIAINTSLEILSLPFSTVWLDAAPLVSCLSAFNLISLSIYRNEGQPKRYAYQEIARTLVTASATLFLLINLEFGWYAIILAQLLGLMIASVIGLLYLHNKKYLKPSQEEGTELTSNILRISIPMIPHTLSSAAIMLIDRLFISYYLDSQSVGIYSLGYQIGSITSILIDSFILAWSPWFYAYLNQNKDKIYLVKRIYLCAILFLGIGVLTSILSPLAIKLVTPESYHGATIIASMISLAAILHGFYKLVFPFLVHVGKTGFLALSTTTAAITNIVFNILLIPVLGLEGAAIATALSFGVSFLLVFLRANYLFKMPWFLNDGKK